MKNVSEEVWLQVYWQVERQVYWQVCRHIEGDLEL